MSNILSYHDIIGLNNHVLREWFFFEKGITEDSELKDRFIHPSGLLSACLSLSLVPLFWKFNELVGIYKLIVMIWIRMTHIGSYSWMFSYQEWHYLRRIRGFDLVGVGVFLVEEVCCWEWTLRLQNLTSNSFSLPPLPLCAPSCHFCTRRQLSTTARVPCLQPWCWANPMEL